MAKPRLKIYRTRMGFVEAVVAAPSQKAALEAWGARQNLFAEGLAEVTEDAGAVATAMAKPGVVLQRPVGGGGDFTAKLVGRPEVPRAKMRPAASKPAAKAAKPKPDRSALTAAEKSLAALEEEATVKLAELGGRRELLDAEEGRLRGSLDARRVAAQQKVDAARRKFGSA